MTTWFDQMAALVHKREIALAGMGRWQKKLDAVEAEIAELTATLDNARTATPEPAPVVEDQVAEAAQLSPDLRSTFGATEPSIDPFSVAQA